jgi:hypothetical protein
MPTKTAFIQQLRSTFKGLENQPLESLVSENLISPFTIGLPKSILKEAQDGVDELFHLRENKKYQESYANEIAALGLKDPGNKSICMSYDFHVDSENHLKLIEVNTNASFLALGYLMYQSKRVPLPVPDFAFNEFKENIETELELFGKKGSPQNIAVIDEVPEQQRLYVEFLVYRELFTGWGWSPQVLDYRQIDPAKFDFIYNRYTDFFLNNPESAALKKAFLAKESCFSPNPYEYLLLADKQRMIDWSLPSNLDKWDVCPEGQGIIQSIVPPSVTLDLTNKEEIWAQRKNYFFKPKRAYGSKQSYKGASVSRKVFEEIAGQDFIAQTYVAPSEQVFTTPDGDQSFKFDLRCYAYQGRLQLIVARLYQGQVTNLRTPLGGFACVEFY